MIRAQFAVAVVLPASGALFPIWEVVFPNGGVVNGMLGEFGSVWTVAPYSLIENGADRLIVPTRSTVSTPSVYSSSGHTAVAPDGTFMDTGAGFAQLALPSYMLSEIVIAPEGRIVLSNAFAGSAFAAIHLTGWSWEKPKDGFIIPGASL